MHLTSKRNALNNKLAWDLNHWLQFLTPLVAKKNRCFARLVTLVTTYRLENMLLFLPSCFFPVCLMILKQKNNVMYYEFAFIKLLYFTRLYGQHEDLVGTCKLCTLLHDKNLMLSYEYREHYGQYIIIQAFTA